MEAGIHLLSTSEMMVPGNSWSWQFEIVGGAAAAAISTEELAGSFPAYVSVFVVGHFVLGFGLLRSIFLFILILYLDL